jgi:hypothetical protein
MQCRNYSKYAGISGIIGIEEFQTVTAEFSDFIPTKMNS